MESRSIFKYIHFGESVWYLRRCVEGTEVKHVIEESNNVLRDLEEFPLPVTLRAARNLRNVRDKFVQLKKGSACTAKQAEELGDIMAQLESTLVAEAGGHIAFIVTDKRIDVNKLLNNVSSLLAPEVFDLLSEVARYDLAEAGKCIAFERPTSAAFHLLRGTEAVVRQLYCSVAKKKKVELTWGSMVTNLRQRKRLGIGSLLDRLDYIRLTFRNPTQHPEKIYDIQEVQDLFGLCVDVVNRMVAFMVTGETS